MKKIVTGILAVGAACMTVSAATKTVTPAAKGAIKVNTQRLQDPFPFLPEVVAEFDGKKNHQKRIYPVLCFIPAQQQIPFPAGPARRFQCGEGIYQHVHPEIHP